ncbi:MAG: cell division protein ZapB [Cellvibrionales bacterium]|nr:cell division protein ZapB [Cellvibrionales bacterium]
MSKTPLKSLEAKIDELIAFATHLQRENASLRERENGLLQENAQLLERNQFAHQRVKAISTRLKEG